VRVVGRKNVVVIGWDRADERVDEESDHEGQERRENQTREVEPKSADGEAAGHEEEKDNSDLSSTQRLEKKRYKQVKKEPMS
jgi:hypothetical protein